MHIQLTLPELSFSTDFAYSDMYIFCLFKFFSLGILGHYIKDMSRARY